MLFFSLQKKCKVQAAAFGCTVSPENPGSAAPCSTVQGALQKPIVAPWPRAAHVFLKQNRDVNNDLSMKWIVAYKT